MAWPNDKAAYKAPVKSKLQKKIDATPVGTVAGALGKAATIPPRVFSTVVEKAPVTQVASAVANTLSQDSATQKQAIGAITRKRVGDSRRGLVTPFNSDLNAPATVIRTPPVEPVSAPAVAVPVSASVQPTRSSQVARQALISKAMTRGSVQQPFAGTQQVGNMDVTFDKSVPTAARQAFMTNPVEPTAGIQRYQDYMNTPRGRFFGATPVSDDTERPIVMNTFGQVMQEKARRSLIKDNAAMDAVSEKNRIDDQSNKAYNANQVEKNRIDEEGNLRTAGIESAKNALTAKEVASQSGLRSAQADQAQTETEVKQQQFLQERQVAKLTDTVINGKTPEARKEAAEMLKSIGEVKGSTSQPEIIQTPPIEERDPETGALRTVPGTIYRVDKQTGTSREVVPEGVNLPSIADGQASYLKYKGTAKEAAAKAAFIKQFGLDPETL